MNFLRRWWLNKSSSKQQSPCKHLGSKSPKPGNLLPRRLTLRFLTAWTRSLSRTAPPSTSLLVSTSKQNSKTGNFS
ncbi:hypothetical protein EFT40_08555 [Lentilactobacillus parabuchneri]|nr:hypothetical protein [Lentilactobacillus parabuchneri]TLQ30305.1 hypothetical protein FEZ39_08945 [Lentilactobacillus parabuchneri]